MSYQYEGEAESPKYLKRKIRAGQLSLDHKDGMLIVSYDIEASVISGVGDELKSDSKTHQIKLRIKKLDRNTNIPALAGIIMEKFQMIPQSKLDQLIDLLYKLRDKVVAEAQRAPSDRELTRELRAAERRRRAEESRRRRHSLTKETNVEEEVASMEVIDDYMEELYEDDDISKKVHATRMILQLAKKPGNLQELIEKENLMRGLSRLFKDDHKKSTDLMVNILYIFYSISTFSQFHDFLKKNSVGASTMAVLDLEFKRIGLRREELKNGVEKEKVNDSSMDLLDPPKEVEKEEPEEKQQQVVMPNVKVITRKQERIFFVALHLLMNLAEDVRSEYKMVKRRQLIQYLVQLLDHNNTELLSVVIKFLKKLSIFEENKDKMIRNDVVEKLVRYIPCSNQPLMQLTLRLLFNLSFDVTAREQMVKNSLIPKLVELLKKPSFRAITLKLLYHLSKDDRCKTMFTYTEAIPYVMQLLINFPQNRIPKELVALAINLSINGKNCELMVKGQGLKLLIDRVCRTRDDMLMKVVRNIAIWTHSVQQNLQTGAPNKQRTLWAPFVQSLVRLVKGADNANLLVEVLGTLSNLTPADVGHANSFADVIINYGLVEFFQKHLVPGFSQDDIVLEVVMLIGTMCLDEDAARLLSSSPLIKMLHEVMLDKQDDAEIVLQTLFTFFRLLCHKDTSHELLYQTKMPRDACELLNSDNKVVALLCEFVLELVQEHDEVAERKHLGEPTDALGAIIGHISKQIRAKRFALHNKEWIEVISQDEQDDSDFESKGEADYFDESQSTFDARSPLSPSFDGGLYFGDEHDMQKEHIQLDAMLGGGKWEQSKESDYDYE